MLSLLQLMLQLRMSIYVLLHVLYSSCRRSGGICLHVDGPEGVNLILS